MGASMPEGKSNSSDGSSWVPSAVGFTKPHHYLDIARFIWDNRASLPYAWRIERHFFIRRPKQSLEHPPGISPSLSGQSESTLREPSTHCK